jgi:tetratricopeptide (TPR) repeat protein
MNESMMTRVVKPGDERPPTGIAASAVWQFVALAAIVVAAYWPSFSVPFYLDDYHNIVENPRLHDVTNWQAIWEFAPQRFIGSLTLAFNYAVHGPEVWGFHLLNALIHLMAGFALWALLAAMVRSPAVDRGARSWLLWLPLIGAAIFLLHPLQTQAVTYIVQRYASLAAMFYLASLAAYAWGRLHGSRPLLLAALILAALAVFTKQNAVTVFPALLLTELLFFRSLDRRGVALLVAAAAGASAILLWLTNFEAIDGMLRETSDISRSSYFATQVGVLWRYVLLFVLPTEQRLEYDIALATDPFSPAVMVAAGAHLAVLTGALLLWRRVPLVAFGILFFYLAHLVESSVFPISDLAFEHRTYLPNAGLAILAALGLLWLTAHGNRNLVIAAGAALMLSVLGWLTFERNRLWQDQIAFLQADARLSPEKERAWTSLGKELMRRERFEEALDALGKALNLGRTEDGLEVSVPTLLNAVYALHYTGQHRKGFRLAGVIPVKELSPLDLSRLLEVRGMALAQLRRPKLARRELDRAFQAYPNPNTLAWIAYVDLIENQPDAAAERAAEVLASVPDHPLARDILDQAEALRDAQAETPPRQGVSE